jgi:hypothetical protein
VLKGYPAVFLASIVTHDSAFEKLEMLQRGECRRVLALEEGQFPDYDWEWDEDIVYRALCALDWKRVRFICTEREHPLLSPKNGSVPAGERKRIARFLGRYGGNHALTTSYLAGHHAFFYGAPNSLPNVLFPLFSRVEDFTIYPMDHFLVDAPPVTSIGMDPDQTPGSRHSRRRHTTGT